MSRSPIDSSDGTSRVDAIGGPFVRVRNRILVGLTTRAYLFPLLQKLRGKEAGSFCTASTDLCIEGFESSANSFVFNVLHLLRPNLKLAHHTHSVANVKRAQHYDVPTLILVRDPVDAIPSLVARFRPGVHEAVLRYVRFYSYVNTVTPNVLLVGFEDVTGDIGPVVRQIEAWASLSFGPFDTEKVESEVLDHIETWIQEHGRSYEKPLPDEARERRKAEVREQLRELPRFGEAQRLFCALEEARETQNVSYQ